MKDRKNIEIRIGLERFHRRLKREEKRRVRKRREHFQYLSTLKKVDGDVSYESLFRQFLPINISYLLSCENSAFYVEKLTKLKINNDGNFLLPKEFSIVDHPKESYKFIQEVTAALVFQKYPIVNIDYTDCIRADLGAHNIHSLLLSL